MSEKISSIAAREKKASNPCQNKDRRTVIYEKKSILAHCWSGASTSSLLMASSEKREGKDVIQNAGLEQNNF